jgi:hypothetical protein
MEKCSGEDSVVDKCKSSAFQPLAANSPTCSCDDSEETANISAEYNNTFNTVYKVSTDKYLGVDEFNETANNIQQIQSTTNEAMKLSDGTNACGGCPGNCKVQQHCAFWKSSDGINEGYNKIQQIVDKFTNSPEMKLWDDYSHYLNLLHILPYVLLLGLFGFFCFWRYDAACCCGCGGRFLRSLVSLLLFALLWLVFFVINIVVVAVGAVIKFAAHEVKLAEKDSALKTDTSLGELKEHLEKNYKTFFDFVFGPLEGPLNTWWESAVVFAFFTLLLNFYGCALCLCRPYRDKRVLNVNDLDSVTPSAGKVEESNREDLS